MTHPKLVQVADGVWRLSLALPWNELEDVHCYLLPRGDEVDLVDCGLKTTESVEQVAQAIGELGGEGARPGRVVVTHIHPDHYGGAGELVERRGARLYLHRLEVPMVPARYQAVDALLAEVREYLVVNGVPPSDAEAMKETSLGLLGFVSPARPALQLDGEEWIRLGRRRLRALWTPGHSPGHVCLFDPQDGILFAGDHLLPDESPNIGLHPQSTPNPLDDYLAGLRAVLDLQPALVLPAHGEPFKDAERRVRELEGHHRRRKAQIEALVGLDTSAWEVTLAVWGRRELHAMRLALQEGLAHLQSLARDGRLEKHVDGGRITWCRPR